MEKIAIASTSIFNSMRAHYVRVLRTFFAVAITLLGYFVTSPFAFFPTSPFIGS